MQISFFRWLHCTSLLFFMTIGNIKVFYFVLFCFAFRVNTFPNIFSSCNDVEFLFIRKMSNLEKKKNKCWKMEMYNVLFVFYIFYFCFDPGDKVNRYLWINSLNHVNQKEWILNESFVVIRIFSITIFWCCRHQGKEIFCSLFFFGFYFYVMFEIRSTKYFLSFNISICGHVFKAIYFYSSQILTLFC